MPSHEQFKYGISGMQFDVALSIGAIYPNDNTIISVGNRSILDCIVKCKEDSALFTKL